LLKFSPGLQKTKLCDYSGYRYNRNPILDAAICVLFDGSALTALGITASTFGLVVITLERYFKIVHAIAHRKHYRNWMTTVGVILPWFASTCVVLFPGMGTTRIVNGQCLRLAIWPNKAMGFVSMAYFKKKSVSNSSYSSSL